MNMFDLIPNNDTDEYECLLQRDIMDYSINPCIIGRCIEWDSKGVYVRYQDNNIERFHFILIENTKIFTLGQGWLKYNDFKRFQNEYFS